MVPLELEVAQGLTRDEDGQVKVGGLSLSRFIMTAGDLREGRLVTGRP